MIKNVIARVIESKNLSAQEATDIMEYIMTGQATPAQIASLLTALRMKGETIEEITGFATTMRKKSAIISVKSKGLIDTCGTGGDCSGTFNISTAAAFVVSAAGIPVAKHGNRSVSSNSGSADVLEALGAKIDLAPEQVAQCIEDIGIGFMFAPLFHSAMKHVMGPRREIGVRTVFNILGPLTNPAQASAQVLGVFSESLTEPLVYVLKNLGVKRAMVVHGRDGLDEITITDKTSVSELRDGQVRRYMLSPEQLGLGRATPGDIKGKDAATNAGIIESIFAGQKGAKRDIVVLNAGAAAYVGGAADSLRDGVKLASEVIENGSAMAKLNEFVEYTSKIEG